MSSILYGILISYTTPPNLALFSVSADHHYISILTVLCWRQKEFSLIFLFSQTTSEKCVFDDQKSKNPAIKQIILIE